MNNVFAIGDIHGCSQTFRKLVMDTLHFDQTDELICLGDYVDRGPDSKGVIDMILGWREQGFQVHTLRGNHDQMMMDSGKDKRSFQYWVENGGKATLKSFGVNAYDELESRYKSFFYHTQFFLEMGKFILVHAGLNFKTEDPFADTHSMMWIRGFKVNDSLLGDRTIVHGHTPIPWAVIKTQQGEKVIDIDGGCVYTRFQGMGYLVAYNLRNGAFFAEENCESKV